MVYVSKVWFSFYLLFFNFYAILASCINYFFTGDLDFYTLFELDDKGWGDFDLLVGVLDLFMRNKR